LEADTEGSRRASGRHAPHPAAWLPEEWRRELDRLGEPAYRAAQIFRWVHMRGVFEPDRMSDLPLGLRGRLAALGLGRVLEIERALGSSDGTRKLLCALERGGRIECVLIPMTRETAADADAAAPDEDADDDEPQPAPAGHGDARSRLTLCLSTQVGCAMGCTFCASGQAGLQRGLDASEIVSQVACARGHVAPGQDLRNLVFMGMGEPLHHYDETARALRLLTHPLGAAISPRRITVSTVGLVPGIRRLGQDFGGKIGLAISLHAPDDATRSRIVPMNRRWPLAELLAALREYPLPRRRRITIEYTLIEDVNDSLAHARALARLLRTLRVKVNLIPMNPISASALRAPAPERVAAFREALAAAGLSAFVRTRRGDDVEAACGQLALIGRGRAE
jgi:23S rRNA (adenine2503-C2)-methyltransferase